MRLKGSTDPNIQLLPPLQDLSSKKNSNVSTSDLDLLQLKQTKLRDPHGQIPVLLAQHRLGADHAATKGLREAAAATLVFSQEAAGTAVCLSPSGLLLTCSHCVAESQADLDRNVSHWLLFSDGRAVTAKTVAWDPKRDLALLQITAVQPLPTTPSTPHNSFPAIALSTQPPRRNAPLHCIGHPGSEDLEASQSGIATDYDVLHISEGRYRGLAPGQDPQDNSEIGALRHDCWTYWGHSGAPLLDRDGGLVGLHSSWDDETGMRRGVAWEAVKAFLNEWTRVVVG
jgi:hypothetical protein